MEFIEVRESCTYFVVSNELDFSEYRRDGDRSWEVLMGESWEPVYTEHKVQELEDALVRYQARKHMEEISDR